MNEKNLESLVNEYIKEVKKALPDWLKDKKEHKEILAELETHIWEKANELSDSGQANEESIRMAIAHMGTPKSIAREYKRRGTPKVYITKELWPLYLNVLVIVFAIIIILNVIGLILNIVSGTTTDLGELLGGLIGGVQSGLFVAFAIVSIIFVALSMEGYFPEDFKSKKELDKKALRVEMGLPPKPFIKPVGEIIGGGIGLVVGVLFIFQPFPAGLFIAEFLLLLRIFGIFMILASSFDITRGIIGNRQPLTHQIIHLIKIILKFGVIPFLIILLNRPDIFPWFSTPWIHVGIPPEFHVAYRSGMIVLVVIIALTSIDEIYKIWKLQKYK
ncbi:MAG: permease prefix domain 1-containing protein [Candidatus Thorarchaeota archaeon]